MPNLADIRREYASQGLHERNAPDDPRVLFDRWLREAITAEVMDPTAMVLSTASRDLRPSSRVVLLKGVDVRGFIFFTNYESRKARELAMNPHASLLFFWPELLRQVRIEGVVERVPTAESEAYWRTRPRESQIGAWASAQGRVLATREELDERFAELTAEYEERDVPLPPQWGGFVLRANAIEFWAGRPNRLHDRLQYTRTNEGWSMARLAP